MMWTVKFFGKWELFWMTAVTALHGKEVREQLIKYQSKFRIDIFAILNSIPLFIPFIVPIIIIPFLTTLYFDIVE